MYRVDGSATFDKLANKRMAFRGQMTADFTSENFEREVRVLPTQLRIRICFVAISAAKSRTSETFCSVFRLAFGRQGRTQRYVPYDSLSSEN